MRTEPVLIGCAYAAALALLGHLEHPILFALAENDGYVQRAAALLEGALPADPYRPALYTFLVAGVGALVGDCFVAAKLVSAAAAGAFVAASHGLAREWFGIRAARLTAVLVACNGHVIVNGLCAMTDMLFSALVVTTLLCASRVARAGRTRDVALAGLSFAMAYFTRYQASSLLLAVLPAIWIGSEPGTRWRRLGLFALVTIGCLIPHFTLNTIVFGHPLHSENWRSIALKYYADMDFNRLGTVPFEGTADVLLRDPARIAAGGVRTLLGFLGADLQALLQGRGRPSWPAYALSIACAIGAVVGWRERRPAYRIALLFAVVFVVGTSFTFHTWPRLMLPLLPVALAGFGLVWARIGGVVAGTLVGALAVAAVALPSRTTVQQQLTRHPWSEVEAARSIFESAMRPLRVVGTYAYTGHLVAGDYVHILPGPEWDVIARVAETLQADFVVLGRMTARRHFAELAAAPPPSALEIVRRDDDLIVLRRATPPKLGPLVVAMPRERSGSIGFEVRALDDTLESVTAVIVLIESPSGVSASIPLEPVSEGHFARTMDSAQLEPGTWRFATCASDQAGELTWSDVVTRVVE